MASHDLINTKPTILGATLGAIPGIAANPHEIFTFDPAFSERFFRNWGGPRAQDLLKQRKNGCPFAHTMRGISALLLGRCERWLQSYKEMNRHQNLPWNFITHGFLDPSAFPEFFNGPHNCASAQKDIAQSITTSLRNPWENDSPKKFRARNDF